MASNNENPALGDQFEALYSRANAATGGRLGILRTTIDRFAMMNGAQASAAIAYYGLFSLFPVLLVMAAGLSLFADQGEAQELVLTVVGQFLPTGKGIEDLVANTFRSVFGLREAGLIGLVALLWSASGVFTTLTYNIDRAFSLERRPSPVKARLIGVAIIAILGLLLIVLLFFSAFLGIVVAIPSIIFQELGLQGPLASFWSARWMVFLVAAIIYTGLYRWVPSTNVPWSIATTSGLLASLATQILNAGFTWFLGSGLARYELRYGPLTAIIVLLFWFYLNVLVILVGAHLAASLVQRRQLGP
jgi:membrane protein